MTACVNKKSKRVAAVVTASLVGALSIGAPAVAFATDTNSGIELLTADANSEFSNGVASQATVGNGGNLNDGKISVVANGDFIDIKVTEVNTVLGKNVPVDTNYSQSFVKADEKGNPTSEAVARIKDPGKYCVVIKGLSGDYKGAVLYVPVTVSPKTLSDVTVYEVNPSNAADSGDSLLYFTGAELDLGIKAASSELVEGVDYEVKFLKDGSSVDASGVEVKDAGTYFAVVNGLGKYAGQTVVSDSFKVNPFNLDSNAVEIVVDPVIDSNAMPSQPVRVYRVDDGRTTELDPETIKLALKGGIFSDKGEYTFVASPAVDKDSNFTVDAAGASKTKEVKVGKYAEKATMLYDGEEWPTSFTTDLANAKSPVFDVTKITAVYGEDGKSEITGAGVKTTVVNADGVDVTATNWNKMPGIYTVKAVATADFDAAVIDTCTVTVKAKSVDADANVYVKYGNKVVTDVTVDYGTAISANDFIVKGIDGEDYNGLDASLVKKLYNEKGEEVASATDAGTYTLKVTSSKYELTGTTEVKVTVNKLDLSDVKLAGLTVRTDFGFTYVKVGGGALNGLNLQYLQGVDADSNGKLDDWKQFNQIDGTVNAIDGVKSVWQKLDEETGQWADVNQVDANETGKFRCAVSPMNDGVTKNVSFATDEGTVLEFYVLDAELQFADVLPTDWWFAPVTSAANDGLMNGYAGTKLFGSTDQLTRGQVACVLFNMAGGESIDLDGDWYNDLVGWKSFDDVDGKAYYGKAISWAKQAGVVNGYADGTFRPDSNVTREEFAAMLANFAKKYNAFVDVDADKVLGEFSDGASVSDWAEEVVAWAVDSEIMGNGGFIAPTAQITRAEAAAMVVNSKLAL